MTTTPTLPLETNTDMLLSCQKGFVNVGGKHATCWSGEIVFQDGEEPLCLKPGKIIVY